MLALLLLAGCSAALAEAQPEKIKLTAIGTEHSRCPDYSEMPVWKKIADEAGVEIQWEIVRSDWATRRSTILGTNNLPDLWVGEWNLDIAHIQSNKEAFLKLNDYIEGSTNVKKMFEDVPELKTLVTFPDGSIYSIPSYSPSNSRLTGDAVFINKAWLDKLGLPVPTTLDEFYDTLVAFKTKDPNGNGKADEIPLVDAKDSISFFANAYGIDQNTDLDWFVVDDNNNISWAGDTEAYKNAVKYLEKIYKNGLCDPETFTQPWQDYYAYCDQDDAVCGVGFAYTIDALCPKHKDEYVYLAPLAGPDGHRGANKSGALARPISFAISASCKNPDAAWRVIETAYKPEYSIQLTYGEFGDHGSEKVGLVQNPDGTYDITKPPEGMNWDVWMIAGTSFYARGYVSAEMFSKIHPSEQMLENEKIDALYKPFMPKHVMPSCYIFDEAINDELSVLKTDITSLMSSRLADWCQGARNIDNDWDAYLSELQTYGIERYKQIYFDRYNAEKANSAASAKPADASAQPADAAAPADNVSGKEN